MPNNKAHSIFRIINIHFQVHKLRLTLQRFPTHLHQWKILNFLYGRGMPRHQIRSRTGITTTAVTKSAKSTTASTHSGTYSSKRVKQTMSMQPEILSSIPVFTVQDDNYTVEDFIDYDISSCIDQHELPYKEKPEPSTAPTNEQSINKTWKLFNNTSIQPNLSQDWRIESHKKFLWWT